MGREYRVTIALAVAVLAACANLPRSRDLGNPEVAGRVLAEQVCSNCHGVTGSSASPNMPNLAGQQKSYLVAQLRGFRGKSRQDPAGYEYMWGISRTLTDRQIDELADYFSMQTLMPQRVESPPEPGFFDVYRDAAKGRVLLGVRESEPAVPAGHVVAGGPGLQ